MLKRVKSVCSPARAIYPGYLLLRQGAVAIQMLERESFLIKQHKAANEAESLKVQQKIAKVKPRFRVVKTLAGDGRGLKIWC